jgi:phospho-N-acetylmuramoyl-pentapeptide-transferase
MDAMEAIILNTDALARVFSLTVLAFVVSMLVTPAFTTFLYRNRLGKKIRQTDFNEKSAPIFYKLHRHKANTPTMGGLLVWITTALLTLVFNFSRTATWLPLAVLVATGVIGAIDDLYNIKGIGPNNGGLRFRHKFLIYLVIAVLGALYFAFKLEWIYRGIHVPGLGEFAIGYWYIPLFILVLIGTSFSVNQTDGLDGLAGGLLAMAFLAVGGTAFFQGQFGLAAFAGTIVGALLAFLWFNIHPARFFMGDTGAMALGMTLAVLCFLTNTVLLLPVIGFVFVLEGLTTIIQIFAKKYFKKKVFLSAPIHHHFEALGWPETRITERAWIIGSVTAVIGLVLSLIGRG